MANELRYYTEKVFTMKIINTKLHGLLDYFYAILILAAPFIFGYHDNETAAYICYFFGTILLISSVCTNYEFGLVKVLPMRFHLAIDAIGGILVMASPWMFGFSDVVFLPHVILGAIDLIVVLLSQSAPSYKKGGNYKNVQHA